MSGWILDIFWTVLLEFTFLRFVCARHIFTFNSKYSDRNQWKIYNLWTLGLLIHKHQAIRSLLTCTFLKICRPLNSLWTLLLLNYSILKSLTKPLNGCTSYQTFKFSIYWTLKASRKTKMLKCMHFEGLKS